MKIATVDVRMHTVILSEVMKRAHTKFVWMGAAVLTVIIMAQIVAKLWTLTLPQTLLVLPLVRRTVAVARTCAATAVLRVAKIATMKRVIHAPLELITATSAHTIFMEPLTIHNINKNYL